MLLMPAPVTLSRPSAAEPMKRNSWLLRMARLLALSLPLVLALVAREPGLRTAWAAGEAPAPARSPGLAARLRGPPPVRHSRPAARAASGRAGRRPLACGRLSGARDQGRHSRHGFPRLPRAPGPGGAGARHRPLLPSRRQPG